MIRGTPKEVEKENTRLRRLVADLSLDNAILKEVSRGNFGYSDLMVENTHRLSTEKN